MSGARGKNSRGASALFALRVTQRCLACGAACAVRSSDPISPMVRAFYWHCTNTDCGETFVSHNSVLHVISPSAIEDRNHPIPPCPSGWVRSKAPAGEVDPNQVDIFELLGSADLGPDSFEPPGQLTG